MPLVTPSLDTTFGASQDFRESNLALGQVRFNYRYPLKESGKSSYNFRPSTPLHDMIVNNVVTRAWLSWNEMSKRYDNWRCIDQLMTSYVSPELASPNDVFSKASTASHWTMKKKRTIKVNVPILFAMNEILMAYYSAVFLNEPPIFRYEGTGGFVDDVKASILEQLIQMQNIRFKTALGLRTFWRDANVYGIGACSPVWRVKHGFSRREDDFNIGGVTVSENSRFPSKIFSGNKIVNFDPYRIFPDHTVSIHDKDSWTQFAAIEETNYETLLGQEMSENNLFNVRYLQHTQGFSQLSVTDRSGRNDIHGMNRYNARVTDRPVHVINSYIKLIPKQWKLGTGTAPELWHFKVAADSVLIQAQPVNLDHNEFPVAVAAPTYDGHNMTPVSLMEIHASGQEAIEFFENSHIANVQQAVNNMFIVDPSIVNIFDIMQGGPGLIARIREHHWGRGIDNGIKQLQVSDLTKGNSADVANTMQRMQMTMGATDQRFGVNRRGSERVSATEANILSDASISRLANFAQIISDMGMNDIAYYQASNNVQFLDNDQPVKIGDRLGDLLGREFVGKPLRISPSMIDAGVDVIGHNGQMKDRNDVQAISNVLNAALNNQLVAQRYDIARLFSFWARKSGFTDINQFEHAVSLNSGILPNEQIQQQQQQGNLVDLNTALGSLN